jgi:hypothetical protein
MVTKMKKFPSRKNQALTFIMATVFSCTGCSEIFIAKAPPDHGLLETSQGAPQRWARTDLPLLVFVDRFAESYVPVVQLAAHTWNEMIGCPVFLVFGSPVDGLAQTFEDTHTTVVGVLLRQFGDPETRMLTDEESGLIGHAAVFLPPGSYPSRHALLYTMHELGHVLGLAHDENPTSLMYESLSRLNAGSMAPALEDVLLLRAIYCAP